MEPSFLDLEWIKIFWGSFAHSFFFLFEWKGKRKERKVESSTLVNVESCLQMPPSAIQEMATHQLPELTTRELLRQILGHHDVKNEDVNVKNVSKNTCLVCVFLQVSTGKHGSRLGHEP